MGASTSNVKSELEPNANQFINQSKVKSTVCVDRFVRRKLVECNCESVLQVFVDNEIDEAAFLLLTEDDLKMLLPMKLGPRKKIWALIQDLHKESQTGTNSLEPTKITSINSYETSQPLTANKTCLSLNYTDNNYSSSAVQTSSYPSEKEEPQKISDDFDSESEYMHSEKKSTVAKYQPVAASTKSTSEAFSEAPSYFYENAAETIRSFVEPQPSHSEFNRLSLNVQFVNHNQILQTYGSVPDTNPFGCKDEEEIEKVVEKEEKEVRRMPMEIGPVKSNRNNDKQRRMPSMVNQNNGLGDGTKKHHRPIPKKVPFSFPRVKQLPIYKYKKDFLRLVDQNPVVIVIAETGSGKSTQMPQYLARANYDKKIICTQPRRLAAKSLAKRVALEFNTKLGQDVGYRVRFDNCTENTTKICYATEGVLVHELTTDVVASNYSVVIIDEAHERNLNTDVLLGCLKKAIDLRPDLKVVISSATVEAKKFSKFFNEAPVLDIPGRSFPVEISYTGNPNPDYIGVLVDKVCRLHNSNSLGDILVFLPGQEDIENVADMVTNRIRNRPNSFVKELVLPLYSKLPSEQQNLIFEPAPQNTRKIILATNIAETSLTIDGIVYVVDSGLVKQAEYTTKADSAALECTTLVTIPITKAQAKQRSGRAGRTQPGVAYRLYSEATYNKMAESPTPEILRGNLEMVVLLLFSMGVKNIIKFDFLDSPPKDALFTALEKLQEFGALSKTMLQSTYTLTSIGRQMSSFPIEPYLSKMLIISADLGCSEEMLTIIAMLSAQVEKLFKRPRAKQMEADLKKKAFNCEEGDHVTLLKVYNEWFRQNRSSSRAWCNEFFLDWRTLEEVYEIRCQLSTMLDEKKIIRRSCGNDMKKVQIAIASGSFRKIAWKTYGHARNATYYTFSSPHEEPVLIHPSSVLCSASPNLVIYNSVIKTKKAYMNQVLEIDREYIQEYANSFYPKLLNVMPW